MKIRPISQPKRGFTLVEILVVITIIAILVTFSVSAVVSMRGRVKTVKCMNQMRGLSFAITLFQNDHEGAFPRSLHSAAAHREPGWTASIYPYLSGNDQALDAQTFNDHFRCPEHDEENMFIYSYGLNVFFELDPDGDDYEGSPAYWHRISQVNYPSQTILIAETRPVMFGDHLMCHLWSSAKGARNALAHDRHQGKSNFLFVDGHIETLKVEETFDPKTGGNMWNPSLAY